MINPLYKFIFQEQFGVRARFSMSVSKPGHRDYLKPVTYDSLQHHMRNLEIQELHETSLRTTTKDLRATVLQYHNGKRGVHRWPTLGLSTFKGMIHNTVLTYENRWSVHCPPPVPDLRRDPVLRLSERNFTSLRETPAGS